MKYAILIAPLLATLAAAQTILIYGTGELPTCAKNCETLNTAQYLCVPPVAPTNTQATYDNCFCQSNYFASTLAIGTASDPSNVCNTACTASSDQLAIQNWYDSLCKSGTTSSTTTTTGVSSATASTTLTSGVDNGAATAETSGQIWWHEHAKWIAMAIVLICAFIIILVLGVWLKRRSVRKHQRAAAMAPPVVWGPHQNQHHTGGISYETQASNSREKGKANAMSGALPTASSQPMDYSEKDGTKKLKKFLGRK